MSFFDGVKDEQLEDGFRQWLEDCKAYLVKEDIYEDNSLTTALISALSYNEDLESLEKLKSFKHEYVLSLGVLMLSDFINNYSPSEASENAISVCSRISHNPFYMRMSGTLYDAFNLVSEIHIKTEDLSTQQAAGLIFSILQTLSFNKKSFILVNQVPGTNPRIDFEDTALRIALRANEILPKMDKNADGEHVVISNQLVDLYDFREEVLKGSSSKFHEISNRSFMFSSQSEMRKELTKAFSLLAADSILFKDSVVQFMREMLLSTSKVAVFYYEYDVTKELMLLKEAYSDVCISLFEKDLGVSDEDVIFSAYGQFQASNFEKEKLLSMNHAVGIVSALKSIKDLDINDLVSAEFGENSVGGKVIGKVIPLELATSYNSMRIELIDKMIKCGNEFKNKNTQIEYIKNLFNRQIDMLNTIQVSVQKKALTWSMSNLYYFDEGVVRKISSYIVTNRTALKSDENFIQELLSSEIYDEKNIIEAMKIDRSMLKKYGITPSVKFIKNSISNDFEM